MIWLGSLRSLLYWFSCKDKRCSAFSPNVFFLKFWCRSTCSTLPNSKHLQTRILSFMKMAESSPKGKKTVWEEERNCSLRANRFPFHTMFSKTLYCRHIKGLFSNWKIYWLSGLCHEKKTYIVSWKWCLNILDFLSSVIVIYNEITDYYYYYYYFYYYLVGNGGSALPATSQDERW